MKHALAEILYYIPFLLIIKDGDDGAIQFKLSFSELLRSVIVPLVIAGVTVLATIKVLESDLKHYASSAARVEAQVTTVCQELSRVNQRLTVVETRQRERIEREIKSGKRKHIDEDE